MAFHPKMPQIGRFWSFGAPPHEFCARGLLFSCVLPVTFCLLSIAHCLLLIAHWLLDVCCCLLAIVCCLLAIVCCILAVVCCLLAIGYWILAVVYWLLFNVAVVYCLLYIVYWLLLLFNVAIAYCLLSVVYCLLAIVQRGYRLLSIASNEERPEFSFGLALVSLVLANATAFVWSSKPKRRPRCHCLPWAVNCTCHLERPIKKNGCWRVLAAYRPGNPWLIANPVCLCLCQSSHYLSLSTHRPPPTPTHTHPNRTTTTPAATWCCYSL
jgi:hypothetical protein